MPGNRASILVVGQPYPGSDSSAELLEADGYQVERAVDGRAALERVGDRSIDLVVLNAELSDGPGLEVLQRLRVLPRRRFLPVVMIGTGNDRALRIAALKLGADDVLTRPLDREELLARVARSLEVRERVDTLLEDNSRLDQLSKVDPLTRASNLNHFHERLHDEFRRAQRYQGPLALILVEVDLFNEVAQRLGPEDAGAALKEMVQRMRSCLRDTDLVARCRGEEFAVLLPHTPLAGSLTVAERLWQSIGRPDGARGERARLTASLGVSGFPHRAVATPDHLLRTATEALEEAKRGGRNKVCLFEQPLPRTERND